MRGFRIIVVVAIICELLAVLGMSIFSLMAASIARLPGRAGRDVIVGYRVGLSDFLALPLFGIAVVAVLEHLRRSARVASLIESLDLTVLSLRGHQVTYGVLLASITVVAFVGFCGSMTMSSLVRYRAISTYCRPTSALLRGSERESFPAHRAFDSAPGHVDEIYRISSWAE